MSQIQNLMYVQKLVPKSPDKKKTEDILDIFLTIYSKFLVNHPKFWSSTFSRFFFNGSKSHISAFRKLGEVNSARSSSTADRANESTLEKSRSFSLEDRKKPPFLGLSGGYDSRSELENHHFEEVNHHGINGPWCFTGWGHPWSSISVETAGDRDGGIATESQINSSTTTLHIISTKEVIFFIAHVGKL